MKKTLLSKANEIIDQISLPTFSFKEYEYIDSQIEETNALNRAWALFAYLLLPDKRNEEIIVKLFKEEIKSRENDVWSGTSETVKIAAYLVSLYQRMEYIPLFIQAKNSNFDMYCSFDREFILSNGLEATLNYININQPDWEEDFQKLFRGDDNNLKWEESDITKWKERIENYMNKWFIKPQSSTDLFDFFIEINDTDIANEIISQSEKEIKEWNAELLTEYIYFYEQLKLTNKVATAKEVLIQYETDNRNKVTLFLDLAEYYIDKALYEKAWSYLKEGLSNLKELDNWQQDTLVSKYIMSIFSIIIFINNIDHKISLELTLWLKNNFRNLSFNSLELYKRGESVFNLLKDKSNKKYCKQKIHLLGLQNKQFKLEAKKEMLNTKLKEIKTKIKKVKKKLIHE